MQLSQHFSLYEFVRSEVALNMGRPVEADSTAISNLTRLTLGVLEPLRSRLNRGIVIHSGLRPVWLNTIVGGATNSDHLYGLAADILVTGMTPREVCNAVKDLDLPVHQCILEFPEHGWTHVSAARLGQTPAREYLTSLTSRGSKVYRPGLIDPA